MRVTRRVLGWSKRLLTRSLRGNHNRQVRDPYTTHVPVLIALGQRLKVERVLELGSGLFSTPLFLDTAFFPDLVRLDSHEDDSSWAHQVSALIGTDPRLTLTKVEAKVWEQIAGLSLHQYDLIFVDDSRELVDRARTLTELARCSLGGAVLVIHDFEHAAYRQPVSKFSQRFCFDAFLPNTGVVWEGARLSRQMLKELHSIILRHAASISPDQREEWRNKFQNPARSCRDVDKVVGHL